MTCRRFPKSPPSKREIWRLIQRLSNATDVDAVVDCLQDEIALISDVDPTDYRIAEYGTLLDALDDLSVRVKDAPWLCSCHASGWDVPTIQSSSSTDSYR